MPTSVIVRNPMAAWLYFSSAVRTIDVHSVVLAKFVHKEPIDVGIWGSVDESREG